MDRVHAAAAAAADTFDIKSHFGQILNVLLLSASRRMQPLANIYISRETWRRRRRSQKWNAVKKKPKTSSGSRGVDSETELGWLGGNLELNLWVWCSFALVSDRRWVITTQRGNKSKLGDRETTEVRLTSDLVESPLTSSCLGSWRIWFVEK